MSGSQDEPQVPQWHGDPPNIAQPQLPQLPPCLEGPDPAGCASPPQLDDWTCPVGWLSQTVGAEESWQHNLCVPPSLEACDEGEAAWLDAPSCQPIGAACTPPDESGIRELAPGFGGDIWYVSPGATGNGGPNAPFGSVTEALEAASDDDILALDAGDHVGPVQVTKRLAIVGQCVRDSRIAAPATAQGSATVTVSAPGARIVNLSILGAQVDEGMAVESTASDFSLESVYVDGAGATGIRIEADATLRQLVVVNTVALDADGAVGLLIGGGDVEVSRAKISDNDDLGLEIVGASTAARLTDLEVTDTRGNPHTSFGGGMGMLASSSNVQLERGSFERNRRLALSVDGADVVLTDVSVRDTTSEQSSGKFGRGIQLKNGGVATLERCRFVGNHDIGIALSGAGVQLTGSHVAVLETQGRALDDAYGAAMQSQDGPVAALSASVFVGNRQAGIALLGNGTALNLTDVVIADTKEQASDGDLGAGLVAKFDAVATLARVELVRNRVVGVYVSDAAQLFGNDLVVRDTSGRSTDDLGGRGVCIAFGGMATLERSILRDNREASLVVDKEGSFLDVQDILIADTRKQADPAIGFALNVQYGEARIRGAFIQHAYGLGLRAYGDSSTVDVQDVVVRDVSNWRTEGELLSGSFGKAITSCAGAEMTVARALVEHNAGFGIVAVGGSIAATDITVKETSPVSWPDAAGATTELGGIAASASYGGVLELERFVVTGNAMCGLQVVSDGTVRASHGVVTANTIGVNVQVQDYPLDSVLSPTVRVFDNDNDLDAVTLPIPMLDDPLATLTQ